MTMTTTNPYADAYDAYWNAGWRGVLPLPYAAKAHPPSGYTGRNYLEPSYADCAAWAAGDPANIALHLPKGVIGIDVDDYNGKGGGATLAALVEQCGPLPSTWLSTSRGDGISGIRLYRVPDSVELIAGLTGIEIIQHSHRYVVCWPSLHPEGMTYEWVDEASGQTGVPHIDALPDLPQEWLLRLLRTSEAAHKADVDGTTLASFFAGLPDGDPCTHVMAAAGLAMRDKARHDAYNDAVLAVLARGRQGCPGAAGALKRLKESFVAEIADRAGRGQADAEWRRSVIGAVGLVLEQHPDQGAGCPDDYVAELMLAETASSAVERPDDPGDAPDQATAVRDLAVARKASEMALVEDARALLASWRAGRAQPLDAHDLTAFLAQPDVAVPYRIDGLWPINGRVLVAAAAKAGKTTLVTNILKALADGGHFLGCHEVEQVTDGTIVYLNLEVSENQIRRWLRRSGIVHSERIVVVNLRGRLSALTLSSEPGRQRVADWLRGLNAQIVILDPLAPLLGALGLEEKENSDIARFFAWWSETLALAGVVDDLICHHAGWDGSRSRGASRLVDEPDAVWTITRDKAVDADGDDVYDNNEPRFIKAIGRDVDLPDTPLVFDVVSGELTLGQGSRKVIRERANLERAEKRVLEKIDAGETTLRGIVKENGNEPDNKKALQMLCQRGVLMMEKVGQAHRYYRVSPVSPTVSNPLATVTVSSPYRGDSNDDGTKTGICEDCGGDTGHAGYILCSPCARKRREV